MFKFKSVGAAWNFVQGIWLTFVATALMFVFVGHLVTTFHKEGYGLPLSTPFSMPVMYFFSFLGIGCLIAGVVFYWKLPTVFFRKMAKKIAGANEKPSPEQSREDIIRAISVLPIIVASLLMGCEVYGFAPVMMGADFSRMLPFAGLSLAAFIILWPRRGLKRRIIARIEGMTGIDAAAIYLGSEDPRRASRMKIIAFSLIVVWWLTHILFSVILPYVLGQLTKTSVPDLLVTLGTMVFWGLLTWRFQKVGGLSLIIFWSLVFINTSIGIIRDGKTIWQFLTVNIITDGSPIVAGILFYLDYRRDAKESPKPSANAT